MGLAQRIDIEVPTEGKVCDGKLCKGKLRPLSDFYTKGKRDDGTTRYDHICKKCKLEKRAEERAKKRAKKSKQKRKVSQIVEFDDCEVEIVLTHDHVKEDLERYLLDFAMDLILEVEDK